MLYQKNKIQKKIIRKSLFAKMLKDLSKSPRLTAVFIVFFPVFKLIFTQKVIFLNFFNLNIA